MRLWLVLVLSIVWLPMANAQSGDRLPVALRHATEWGFTTGGAVDLPGGAQGGEFWAMQLRWGKVLTAPHGPGPLRGTLLYAFEVVPVMVLRQTCTATLTLGVFTSISEFLNGFSGGPTLPKGCTATKALLSTSGAGSLTINESEPIYGGGITPFYWQYNFTSHPRLVPYINLGGGMLFTTQDFPAGTSSFNFTPQAGLGAYWFTRPDRAVNIGLRYHHISNAGISKPNPGHNALYFYAGLSWWR